MKAKNSIVVVVLLLGLSWVILSATNSFQKLSYTSLNETDEVIGDSDIDKISVRNNETFGVKLPQNISFAGEAVPMHDMDVRESLDRELIVNSYWHSSTILMLKRANRWLPIIEPILRENGVPDDFKYLAMAESGLQDVVSPAGATGFWQFLKSAGKEHGLVINSEVDERYHVEKATEAACKYLKQAHDKFGSWTMAAASYNMGMTGLQNQIDRQKQSNYYDLLLNSETGRYVYRILAIKSIHTAPLDYDLGTSTPAIEGYDLSTELFWTPFEITNGSVVQYHIIKYTNGDSILFGTNSGNDTTVVDDEALNSTQLDTICYQVIAEINLNIPGIVTTTTFSQSNIVCLNPIPKIVAPSGFRPSSEIFINKTFKPIIFFGTDQDYTFRVYDRWNRKVFETINPAEGWDGTINSKEAPIDMYVYYVSFLGQDGNTYSKAGAVALVR